VNYLGFILNACKCWGFPALCFIANLGCVSNVRHIAFLLFGVLLGVPYGVFSASFDPAVEGSWLG